VADTNVEEAWEQVSSLLVKEDVAPAVWEAARAAEALVVEEGTFVLGFSPANMRHASYLETSTTASIIRKLLKQVTGQDLQLRCIEGNTIEAWENVKAREQATVERLSGAVRQRSESRAAQGVWDELSEKVSAMCKEAIGSDLPLTSAKLVAGALPVIMEGEAAARKADPDATEVHERQLNRVLERLGTLCNLPATAVALEYLRLTSRRRKGQ